MIASERTTRCFACDGAVQEVSALAAVEEQMLVLLFAGYDTEGNGFISAEHVADDAAALPSVDAARRALLQRDLDPEGTFASFAWIGSVR